MKKSAVILLIFSLAVITSSLSACGDDSTTSAEQPGRQLLKEYSLEDTAKTAADSLGGDSEAATAVMVATTRGYSPSQVANAIESGALDASGAIDSVSPERPAEDMLPGAGTRAGSPTAPAAATASAARVLLKADDTETGRSRIEEIFQQFDQKGKGGPWLAWVLGATAQGYSAEQIIDYLGANAPFEDDSPPTLFGLPVLLDADGDIPEPDLPADWPYEGRNALADLQDDPSFSTHNDLTVLVIGLVNAGYSEDQMQQITEAVWSDSVGLCTTAVVEGEPQFVPCFIQNGSVVPPANETQWTPDGILIEQITPVWPVSITDLETTAALGSGETVILGLRAYTLSDAGTDDQAGEYFQKVTSEDVFLEVRRDSSGYYDVSGSFSIELVQEEDRDQGNLSYEPGERWVYTGTFSQDPAADKPIAMDVVMTEGPAEGEEALEITIGDVNTTGPGADFTVSHYDADGEHTGDVVQNKDNVVWGTLYFFRNMPPSGRGSFMNMAGVTVYWEVVGVVTEQQ